MAERPAGDVVDAELLDRYLAHECSEAEAAVVRRHLMARPELSRALDNFLSELDGAATSPVAPTAVSSWERLNRRMREVDGSQPAAARQSTSRRSMSAEHRHLFAMLPSRGSTSPWRHVALGSAVSGLLAAAVVAALSLSRGPGVSTPERAPETFATANRERAELRLSDGTRIHLAPASRLRVAADYGEGRRDVYLEGEGYFEVEHDARRPFTVYAGKGVARDLGTRFAVRSYAEDRAVQVVVRSGSVAMSNVGRLSAGDVGRLADDGTTSLTRGVAVDSLLAWLDGRLVFRDASLSTVLVELRRWHDVDVRLADRSLGSLPFTGVLTDESLHLSIETIAATLGLHARHAAGRITLERIGGLTPSSSAPPH